MRWGKQLQDLAGTLTLLPRTLHLISLPHFIKFASIVKSKGDGGSGGFNSIINLGRPPSEKSKHPDQRVLRLPEQNRVHRAHLLLPKPAVLSNEQAVSDAPLSPGPEGPPPHLIYSLYPLPRSLHLLTQSINSYVCYFRITQVGSLHVELKSGRQIYSWLQMKKKSPNCSWIMKIGDVQLTWQININ